jgi:phage tail-like protein
MAVTRDKPYSNYNFLVDLGTGETDGPRAAFAEVILAESSVDVIRYRSGNDKESSDRKLPGRAHYGNVTLKRGVIGSLDLYSWYNDVRNGNAGAARNVQVHLQNEDRTEVVLTWKFFRAWPVKYSFSPLNAQGKEVLIEELELAFERMEME